jgi:hypothetical protein
MKNIQIVKKGAKPAHSDQVCPWFIDVPPAPQK